MPVIKIPYTPRLIWRDVIHPALKDKRFAVLVCHRRFGKTIGSINELIKKAVQNKLLMPQYAYLAPYLKQAKLIAWKWLLYYTNPIPGRKVNKSELFVELPSMYSGSPGARIYIIGSDHPDALRGIYLDGVIIDEYAQIKQGVYGEVVRPALADRKGFAYFIGTPKGQNQFYELYQKGKTNENYFTCLYRYDETGILDDDEVEMMRAEMTEAEFRQELLCDYS
ncbi:MAG: terminase family protein, partial [Acidaminococcaceae bacterium]